MTPDLTLLKAFATAAETLSFTRAAERLGLSQPRLSLLIRRLEEQLGFKLFVRAHRRVELTPEGERLRDQTLVLETALRDLDKLIGELRREGRSRLRLGSPRYTLELPERLRLVEDFHFHRPSLKLEVESDRTMPLLERLRAGDLDLVFATVPFDETGLETLFFAQCEVLLAIPQEDPCASLEIVSREAVRDRPFATYPDYIGKGYYRRWFGPFADAGARLVEAHDDHPAALMKFAARRRLWTVVHQWRGLRLPVEDEDRMVLRPLADPDDLRIVIKLVRRAGAQTAIADAFWEAARIQAGANLVTDNS